MFCTKCGKSIENNDMVCPECGQFVEQDLSTQVAAQAQTHNPLEAASTSAPTPVFTAETATVSAPAPVFTPEPAPSAPATPTPVFVATPTAAPPVYMSDTRVPNQPQLEEPMSVGDWIATMLLGSIPVIGLIMMIVWAVGDKKTSRKNYARAAFLLAAIIMGVSILLSILIVMLGWA